MGETRLASGALKEQGHWKIQNIDKVSSYVSILTGYNSKLEELLQYRESDFMKKTFKIKNLFWTILGVFFCGVVFTGCSEDVSSALEDIGEVLDDFNDTSESTSADDFSADNLQRFFLDFQSKGGMFSSNGDVTLYLNDYELGTVEDEEVHCFIMYIDPGEYILSVKEDGKFLKTKEKVRVPDFSDTPFVPAMLVLYKSEEITWLANDDPGYASVSATDENTQYIILPGTEDAVEKLLDGFDGNEAEQNTSDDASDENEDYEEDYYEEDYEEDYYEDYGEDTDML